jgi:hypothetical protein
MNLINITAYVSEDFHLSEVAVTGSLKSTLRQPNLTDEIWSVSQYPCPGIYNHEPWPSSFCSLILIFLLLWTLFLLQLDLTTSLVMLLVLPLIKFRHLARRIELGISRYHLQQSGMAASSGTLLSYTTRNLYRRACESGISRFSDSSNLHLQLSILRMFYALWPKNTQVPRHWTAIAN